MTTALTAAPGAAPDAPPLACDTRVARTYHETVAILRAGDRDILAAAIAERAAATRRTVVETIAAAGIGHVGGDLSVTDILATLFWGVLDISPEDPDRPDRDRFILSKGHCAAAIYTTLASVGYFPAAALPTFAADGSALSGHPNRRKTPGVETNTGPLGHGLPVATGCALGARMRGEDWRTVVVVGDGELQEGSNWEALMYAAHAGLSNLTVVVDRNRLQQGDRTETTNALEPLADRLAAFGLEVRDIDGHDHRALLDALQPRGTDRPVAVIARTTKGKGVSFMEDGAQWHHKVPSPDQVAQALAELASPAALRPATMPDAATDPAAPMTEAGAR